MALRGPLAAYLGVRQANEASALGELQRVGAVQGLLAKQQAQQREAQFRNELSELGPSPTQGSLAGLAARYGTPSDILRTEQASLDRQAQVAATKEMAASRLEQASANAKMMHEFRMQGLKTQGERTAETARHNKVMEGLQGQLNEIRKLATTNKPPTEFQGKNALYGSRAVMSDKVLSDLEEKINLYGLSTKQAVGEMPVVGGVAGVAGNLLLSSNQQAVEQAQRNFVNAVLRQESGAVISQQEFDNAKKQYFPQPGDKEDVIKQKRANRKAAIAGFKRIAGSAWKGVEDQMREITGAPPQGVTPEEWSAMTPEEKALWKK